MRFALGFFSLLCLNLAVDLGAAPGRSYQFLPPDAAQGLSFPVSVDGEWTASTEADWIELDSASGSGSGSVSFNVEANESDAPRQGEIVVGDYTFRVAQLSDTGDAVAGEMLFGLGNNAHGETRANGTRSSFATPVFVTNGILQAVNGVNFTLFLDDSGNLLAYGDHPFSGVPTDYRGISGFKLLDGGVSWISEYDVQSGSFLYLKSDSTLWQPTNEGEMQPIATDVAKAKQGFNGYMYLTKDGDLYGGSVNPGTSGFGRWGTGMTAEAEVHLIATDVIDMALSWFHTEYVRSDGTLWISTSGWTSLLGEDAYENLSDTYLYEKVAEDVVAVEAGSKQVFIKKTDGNLYAFGANESPIFGRRIDNSLIFEPVLIAESVDRFSLSGFYYSMLLYTTESGTSYVAGYNSVGQIGAELWSGQQYDPTLLGARFRMVSNYYNSTLLVDVDGNAFVAGQPVSGSVPYEAPAFFDDGSGARPILAEVPEQIEVGEGNVFAVMADGTLLGLGLNYDGIIQAGGPSSFDTWQTMGVGVERIDAYNGQGMLVLRRDGTLWARGSFAFLSGIDTLSKRFSAPGDELVAQNVIDMALSRETFYYIDGSNQLWGIGSNDRGQMGRADTSAVFESKQLIDTGVTEVWAGESLVFYAKGLSSFYGLGNDSSGELGDGDAVHLNGAPFTYVPVPVAQGVVSAQNYFDLSLIRKADGNLFVMGQNFNNTVGDTYANKIEAPTLLSTRVTDMAMTNRTLLYASDGTLYGHGYLGYLGFDGGDVGASVVIATGGVSKAGYSNFGSGYFVKEVPFVLDSLEVEASSEASTLRIGFESVAPWIALTDADWITVPVGLQDQLTGKMSVQLAANLSFEPRVGFVTVSGVDLRITQGGLLSQGLVAEVRRTDGGVVVEVGPVSSELVTTLEESSDLLKWDEVDGRKTMVEDGTLRYEVPDGHSGYFRGKATLGVGE